MIERYEKDVKIYRVPFGGVYKKRTWAKKKYE